LALLQRVENRLKRSFQNQRNYQRIKTLSAQVNQLSMIQPSAQPVVFFNASTRIEGLSLNAAYSLLAGWGLKLAGVPVVNFICKSGLSRCVLGTNRENPYLSPPCPVCIRNSTSIYSQSQNYWFGYVESQDISECIKDLALDELLKFEFKDIPLGKLVLPSVRWILRRHNLIDDEVTLCIVRDYITSAWNIFHQFNSFMETIPAPQAVVVFNGMFYPEATVRWSAKLRNIPTYSFEVGMQPFSAFFTSGEATAYPLKLPSDFHLNSSQNSRLDEYMQKRFQGDFITAGIRFWPEMHALGDDFWAKIEKFKQFVPVFTNIVFDTSQSHANIIFPHMFAWLDAVLEEIRRQPDTLFAIRAHPDELRPGKESRESVAQWVQDNKVDQLANVIFIKSNEYISSYELVKHAKFVMVYNSTVGLEASIMGKPVLCAGRARYTQIPTVFFPKDVEEFRKNLLDFLIAPSIRVPAEYVQNARKILYGQLFMASLPFEEFIECDEVWDGFVCFKQFPTKMLKPENSDTIRTIVDGIIKHGDFLLKV